MLAQEQGQEQEQEPGLAQRPKREPEQELAL
jgi:hypothetical protein